MLDASTPGPVLPRHRRSIAALVAAFAALACASPAAASGGGAGLPSEGSSAASPAASGGAPPSGPAPTAQSRRRATVRLPRAPAGHARAHWLHGVAVTEYWPAPESWFVGALVDVPGLTGQHRIDWLYSARGVSMEGEGIGLDGSVYHIDSLGTGGWVTEDGHSTLASRDWLGGTPYWRAGGFWANVDRAVTFPLAAGGWSNGAGRKYVPLTGVTFAAGHALPLHFLQSIAVDPRLIALGSRVYIPAYKDDGHGGWFLAQDTGGAIKGRHVDVYRRPPDSPDTSGRSLTSQAIYVIPPARQ